MTRTLEATRSPEALAVAGAPPFGSSHSRPLREESVDVLRGVVMLLMLFVNDVGGVDAVPWWLKHYPETQNGMTITDVVFPAFLFVVGMSVPLALGRRLARGESGWEVLGRVVLRTLCLLTMGVFMVNMRGWGWWPVLALGGLIMAFGSVRGRLTWVMRAIGVGVLVYLALAYRAYFPSQTFGPQWWGILGLIGWAYLVAGVVFLLMVRSGSADVVGTVAAAVLVLVFVADASHSHGDLLRWGPIGFLSHWIDFGSMVGTHGCVAVLGVMVGAGQARGTATRRAVVVAGVATLAGLLLYPAYGVNKTVATPAWGLWSAALTAGLFAVIVRVLFLVEGRGSWLRRWLAYMGSAALLLYLLQPLWFRAWSLAGWSYGALAPGAWTGCVRGLAAAAVLSGVAWIMGRAGYSLRV